MSMITVTVGGFEGKGASLKRATENAIKKADSALSGSYTPHIVAYRGFAALVARDPVGGWGHCLIADESGVREGRQSPSLGGFGDLDPDDARVEAIRCAIRHVAQLGWKPEDGPVAPAIVTDKVDRSDFESWARWQIRMRALMGSGLSDGEARTVESGFAPWPVGVPVPCPR